MVRTPDELYTFVASHYYATGEGSTISLLITRAYPRTEDYEDSLDTPRVLKTGPAFRALRQFAETFDGFTARGAEIYNHENFMKKYGHHLPAYMAKNLTSDDPPGNLNYSSQLHLNFS